MAKGNFFMAKLLARDYVYMHVYSVQGLFRIKNNVLHEGEECHGNQKHSDFCLSHDSRALGFL